MAHSRGVDQADGALSYAAVTRGGPGPPAPSLCRFAERPADLIRVEAREVQPLLKNDLRSR
jgi:hypothetical protein